jgi:hypothetical protein
MLQDLRLANRIYEAMRTRNGEKAYPPNLKIHSGHAKSRASPVARGALSQSREHFSVAKLRLMRIGELIRRWRPKAERGGNGAQEKVGCYPEQNGLRRAR